MAKLTKTQRKHNKAIKRKLRKLWEPTIVTDDMVAIADVSAKFMRSLRLMKGWTVRVRE